MPTIPERQHRWPEGAIVYHIYPRSFQDTNGDGVGDLPGITRRLDYLRALGVNAIWLSPFYPSPMVDFGYDIADYCNVDPMFGTLDDFRELLSTAHQKDIRVMIDLVPNHTSDEHAWFQESASSRNNPKANWYVWRDAIGYTRGTKPLPPNNWRNVLTGEGAWKWHAGRRQFYLHSFHERQPDLNWTNPEVRDAFMQVIRFWLDIGVDGFRVDAVYWLAKDPLFHDDELRADAKDALPYDQLRHINSCGWPPVYAYLTQMCNVLKEEKYHGRELFMVTEAYPPEQNNHLVSYLQFYVGMDPTVAAPFNFEGVGLPWEPKPWRRFLKGFYTALSQLNPLCIASNAFGNHDQPRLVSRIGEAAARSAAVMLLTMPGMAFVYYGEEIGMHNVPIPPDQVRDPAITAGKVSRDPERTPMQWTSETNAGFTVGEPWLPVSADYTERNVEAVLRDPHSFLALYMELGKLRNVSPALKWGELHSFDCGAPEVVSYTRTYGHETAYAVCINFSDQPVTCQLPVEIDECVISSTNTAHTPDRKTRLLNLAPNEAVVCTTRAVSF